MIIKELQEFKDFDSWGGSLFLNKRENGRNASETQKKKVASPNGVTT
jgi:hypothetical protein